MGLTASQGSTVTLWNLETGEAVQVFSGHGDFVHDAVFSADGSRLWTVSDNGEIIAWNVATGTEEYRYFVSASQLWDIDISPDGQQIVTATPSSIILWQTNRLSLQEVIDWTKANRFTRPLSPLECQRYHVDCES